MLALRRMLSYLVWLRAIAILPLLLPPPAPGAVYLENGGSCWSSGWAGRHLDLQEVSEALLLLERLPERQ